MRIQCERSGGFAGLVTKVDIDTDELSAAQKREFQTLIEQSGLLDQRGKKTRAAQTVADGFQYDLNVIDEGEERHIRLDEGSATPAVMALLDWLMAYRPPKRK